MNAPPYQKLFWGSYHKHTAHLSHAREHGAYLLLIGALWNNEGRLPADDDTLAGYAKLTVKEWLAIKPKLINGSLLKVVRGKLTQPRVTEDLAKYRDTSGKRKQAGKAGGLASSGKRSGNPEANASGLATKPEPEPEPKEESPPTPQGGRRKPKRSIPDGFPEQPLIDEQQSKARSSGANIDIANQAERFRNWAIANDARYADWPSTWRNWCDRSIKSAPKTPMAALAKPCPAGQDEVWRRRVREFKSNRYWPTDDLGPCPGRPGCRAPVTVLAEFGLAPRPANDAPLLTHGAAA